MIEELAVSRAYLEGLLGLGGERLDAVLQADIVAFERMQRGQRMDAPKQCVKGISCGSTCIAPGKQCRAKASPAGTAKLRQLLALPAAGESSSKGEGGARPRQKAADPGAPAPAAAAKGGSGPKAKRETISQLRSPVLAYFGVKTAKQLLADKNFKMATAGEDPPDVTDRESWAKLHRQFIGVPKSERNLPDGPTVINGIDVLKNFRPWHVFGLDPKKATADDVNKAFRRLVKQHHPDVGGDRRTFERLQSMRDSVLYFLK